MHNMRTLAQAKTLYVDFLARNVVHTEYAAVQAHVSVKGMVCPLCPSRIRPEQSVK